MDLKAYAMSDLPKSVAQLEKEIDELKRRVTHLERIVSAVGMLTGSGLADIGRGFRSLSMGLDQYRLSSALAAISAASTISLSEIQEELQELRAFAKARNLPLTRAIQTLEEEGGLSPNLSKLLKLVKEFY
jgi:ribosomal protein L29